MPIKCVIDFENNPHKVVYAGEALCGTIKLALTEEKRVRGIYIRILGRAYCRWTNGTGKHRRSYTGREIYLNEKVYLLGGRVDEVHLASGVQSHSFRCNLPEFLPTSVEGGVGYIRYTVNVVIQMLRWRDKEFQERFTVLRPLDLNAVPTLRIPISVQHRSEFCLGGFLFYLLSDPIDMIVNVPVRGYTPGQTINMEINVKNRSNQMISEFQVNLIKKINFSGAPDSVGCSIGSIQKVVKCLIASIKTQGCCKNSNKLIQANLIIPPIPPTDFTSSSIVKVIYYLRVSATVGLFHKNPVLKIPITIGTRPIQDFTLESPIQTLSSPTLSLPPEYITDDDPPTYAEAVYMIDSIDNYYRPKYPIFNRTTSYSNGI